MDGVAACGSTRAFVPNKSTSWCLKHVYMVCSIRTALYFMREDVYLETTTATMLPCKSNLVGGLAYKNAKT